MGSNLTPFSPPDLYHLRAAQGWLELGNPGEANAELASIDPEMWLHPDVLELQWHVCFKVNLIPACLEIGSILLKIAPDSPDSWIRASFALHRLGRSQEALEMLLPAAERFSDTWQIPYNLSCYYSALGRLDDALQWFIKAALIDETSAQKAGLDDTDLEPLWASLSKTLLKEAG